MNSTAPIAFLCSEPPPLLGTMFYLIIMKAITRGVLWVRPVIKKVWQFNYRYMKILKKAHSKEKSQAEQRRYDYRTMSTLAEGPGEQTTPGLEMNTRTANEHHQND